MTSGFFSGDILRGLAARVLLFLSLALLPIGLIAIVQTREISEQSRNNAELSLIGVTKIASTAEQRVFQDAFSAARALSSVVRLRRNNTVECSNFLKEYKEASGLYSLVAFMTLDGIMSCSSTGQEYDFSDNPAFIKALKEDRAHAINIERPAISDVPVTLVYAPVQEDGETVGILAVSVPFTSFNQSVEASLPVFPLAVMTFNLDGDILTTERAIKDPVDEIPDKAILATISGPDSKVFRAVNTLGEDRVYAVVPVVPDAIYALSVWPPDAPFLQTDVSSRLAALLPVFMWGASLIVAFWALNRLAIKHIRKLGRQMRRFAVNRTLPRDTLAPSVPTELVDMQRAFLDMAEAILQDEARVEDSLREKNILLKEVHHRVKNNLQLISSIMNMQIRQAQTEDERGVLRRLQRRILSLATVHENLYQNDNLVRVDASSLLRSAVDQVLAVGLDPQAKLDVSQTYEPVMLEPDDAAPLTLAVTEAMTNALKYFHAEGGETARIAVDLSYTSAEEARLTVENSASASLPQEGTGLGVKLITAFTRQLNGHFDIENDEGIYRLTITFPVPKGAKPVLDY